MTDIIRLLPDAVANQIAAGEVIQRPASVVKELMENSIDAGATQVQLIIREAGKSLIQVTDNGQGMSEQDARMCFERHATSKLKKAEDLFAIRTMGFRGEALASIAAVARVELKSRRHHEETGTEVIISASKIESQEPCAVQPGTSILVKNLFYNIPARRNFLKSNAAETRHIVEEFQRVAMAHPDIGFSMHHDGFEVFRLAPGNLKQRIIGIYGNSYQERLVAVEEETTILSLRGYILKPEFARKTRGEQYFFVNNRFIKNGYLHHAVTDAFEDLLTQGTFPSYYLFIDIEPSRIDVNIHPTKTEIKFEDERSVYAILRAAVKRSLGKFSITPSLDFEQETSFNIPVSMYQTPPRQPVIRVNPGFNPFENKNSGMASNPAAVFPEKGWDHIPLEKATSNQQQSLQHESLPSVCKAMGQLRNKYIVALYNQQLILIDQQAAHQRILYERNIQRLKQSQIISQQELFPQTMEFNEEDFILLKELSDDIRKLGFDLREFGQRTFVLNGIPTGINPGNEREIIDQILESYKNFSNEFRNMASENLARSLAGNLCIKQGEILDAKEMQQLADDLFSCEHPAVGIRGRKTFINITPEEIEDQFDGRKNTLTGI
jgi:DNA mismatch repair protein MutL